MSAVLETIGLGKRYGHRWALQDCTLSIPEGKVVGLVGPNGAGKTTLLHLAVGLLAPTAGTIAVLGGRPDEGPNSSRGRLRRPGHADLRPTVSRRASPHGDVAQPDLGRRGWPSVGSNGSASTDASGPGRCPAASEPSSPSRSPSLNGQSCCFSTSRWPAWTPSPVASSSRA